MLDEHGREMHGSWGNMIDAEDAFARMGADVMRWQYCAQPPNQNLLFGFGPAHEIKRKLLTLWNSCKFLVDYAQHRRRSQPTLGGSGDGPGGELEPLDRWLVERTHAARRRGDGRRTRADAHRRRDPRLRGVRRRRVQLVHPPLAQALLGTTMPRSRTLWYALVQGLRVVAPLMPFLTDHLWRVLTAPCADAPRSVHLAGWPETAEPDASSSPRSPSCVASSSSVARRARRRA